MISIFRFDKQLTTTVDTLARKGKTNRGGIIRRAIALFKVVVEGQKSGDKLYIVNAAGERTLVVL